MLLIIRSGKPLGSTIAYDVDCCTSLLTTISRQLCICTRDSINCTSQRYQKLKYLETKGAVPWFFLKDYVPSLRSKLQYHVVHLSKIDEVTCTESKTVFKPIVNIIMQVRRHHQGPSTAVLLFLESSLLGPTDCNAGPL